MLTEYETGFTILETPELTGTALLTDVADRLEMLLSDRQGEASPVSTEQEISASSGYAIIGSDRAHPFDPDHTLRVQARLCTEGQTVKAQIRSRFISADDNDPADLTAGPPPILKEIVDNYDCKIGIDRFQYRFKKEAFLVEDVPTAKEVMNFIAKPNRKIPVLVLTDDPSGNTAIESQLALDYLLGLALVVRFKGNTSSCIGETPGIPACFNGAMRFFWPGGSVSKFYWPNDPASNNVTQFQKDCLENADTHDLNGDFEQVFSAVRTRAIREQRNVRERTEHHETVTQLAEAMERISELEQEARETNARHEQTVDELLEQLNNARTNTTSDSDKDRDIKRLNTAVNQWKRRLKQAQDSVTELREENSELKEALDRVEADATATSIPVITETARGDELQLTGNSRIDNITIINHAINIYRNPARQYIIKAMRKFYNDVDEICNAIERTMNSDDDIRRMLEAKRKKRPQDGIDVGHFEHIVMNNRACFVDKTRLSTKMGEVRQVRNAAAHPEYDGIDNLRARDGINKIAGALREMGNNNYGDIVERLRSYVR